MIIDPLERTNDEDMDQNLCRFNTLIVCFA